MESDNWPAGFSWLAIHCRLPQCAIPRQPEAVKADVRCGSDLKDTNIAAIRGRGIIRKPQMSSWFVSIRLIKAYGLSASFTVQLTAIPSTYYSTKGYKEVKRKQVN